MTRDDEYECCASGSCEVCRPGYAVWHDEAERWQRTGRLDQGPCWCPECLPRSDR